MISMITLPIETASRCGMKLAKLRTLEVDLKALEKALDTALAPSTRDGAGVDGAMSIIAPS